MKITVIIGGTMQQAKQELHRRVRELPRGSVKWISQYEAEISVHDERLIVKSGQVPHCLDGIDHQAEIVVVGQLELIRDEVRERIEYLRTEEK